MDRAILVVEDSVDDKRYIETILREAGYNNLSFAPSYKRALEALNSQNFDVVLIDINLNDNKDGILLAETIDADYSLPYVFVTGYHQENSAIFNSIATLRYRNYVPKPINKEFLILNINAVSNCQDYIEIASNAQFNQKEGTIKVCSKRIVLPEKPKKLLTILSQNINKLVDLETIYNYVWSSKQPSADSSLRELKRTLIKSLKNLGIEVKIKNERNRGLKLIFQKDSLKKR